jgi:hypothetical protein
MRKINKNSRRGVINLFADFILTKIDKKENSIIQVTDCGPFVVINGQTTSETQLDIPKITSDFFEWFSDILKELDIKSFNTIDLIKYDQEINNIEKGWVNVNKSIFVEEPESLYQLAITSEFPYGYSLNCGRLMTYYSHYIFNHMYSLLGVDEVDFYFTKEEDENEDFKIKVVSNSKINSKTIKSLILDVFSLDLREFNERIGDYDILQDILFPDQEKPYTKQDMLEHVILF